MMKKILGLVLAGAMVLSMAACGNDGASGSASGDGSQAADGTVFKIGSIGPTTGDNAIYGNACLLYTSRCV